MDPGKAGQDEAAAVGWEDEGVRRVVAYHYLREFTGIITPGGASCSGPKFIFVGD